MAALADSSGIAYVSTHAVFISAQVSSYAYGEHGVTVEVIESAQCQSFGAIIGTYSSRQLETGIPFIIGQRMKTTHGHGQSTDGIYLLGHIMNLVVQTGNISLTGSGFLLDLVLESIVAGFTGSGFITDSFLVGCDIVLVGSNVSSVGVDCFLVGCDIVLVGSNVSSVGVDCFLVGFNVALVGGNVSSVGVNGFLVGFNVALVGGNVSRRV